MLNFRIKNQMDLLCKWTQLASLVCNFFEYLLLYVSYNLDYF